MESFSAASLTSGPSHEKTPTSPEPTAWNSSKSSQQAEQRPQGEPCKRLHLGPGLSEVARCPQVKRALLPRRPNCITHVQARAKVAYHQQVKINLNICLASIVKKFRFAAQAGLKDRACFGLQVIVACTRPRSSRRAARSKRCLSRGTAGDHLRPPTIRPRQGGAEARRPPLILSNIGKVSGAR